MTQASGQTAVIGIANSFLQSRLKMITQTIPRFWEQRLYTHFTNHGPEHSERVLNQKIAQLAQGLPLENRLNDDEVFIISASAWLYEIGMQSSNLQSVLDFAYEPTEPLTIEQLLRIRNSRHLLTRQLIADSIRPNYAGPKISLGLSNEPEDYEYTRAIAEVCRWCSQEDLEQVDEFIPVKGILVRLRLLVALLRLADQLYIDSARINREQLLAFRLPPLVEARWWSYHYTQILPINKGKLRFYYSLPIGQRQFLGYIRALIEPTFDYANNPLIRYLDDKHDLSLSVQQQPQVRLDQQEGFLQEMPWEMTAFLRTSPDIKPIETRGDNVELVGYTEAKPQERHPLLVLDYENLLLQLGLDGYFPTFDELKKLIISITVKAHNALDDLADLWALGHWQRPDMQAIRDELDQLSYQLKFLHDDSKSMDVLQSEFASLLQRSNAPNKTLLVTPREELRGVIRQFRDRTVPISVWLCDFNEISIFQVITRQPQALSQVVSLPSFARIEPEELEELQDFCILALDDALHKQQSSRLEITQVAHLLNGFSELGGHGEWWKLWLLKQGILLCEETQQGYSVKLESSHKAVNGLSERREMVIKAAQHLENTQRSFTESSLLQQLILAPQLRNQPERTARFCRFLLHNGLLLSITNRSGTCWKLNDNHWCVRAENSDVYLSLLVVGIDHFLLRERYTFIHEHILAGKLAHYIGYNTVPSIYQLAREQCLLQSRVSMQTFRESNDHMIEVQLVEEHLAVRQALRNCYLLLIGLYHHGSPKGLTRDELWTMLQRSMQRCFTLSSQAFDRWLAAFERTDLLRLLPRAESEGAPVRLLLNLDNPLVIRLLARPNLLNLIKQISIIRRGRTTIPVQEILEKFTQYVTHNARISQLTFQFARDWKIVIISRQESEGKSVEYAALDYQHPFLRDLQRRNLDTCTTLAQVVADMSLNFPQNRVPAHKLLQAMEHDSRYGVTHEEYDYWIQQAIHKHDVLADNVSRGYTGPIYYWAKPKAKAPSGPVEVK